MMRALVVVAALTLAGCVTTQEMPVAPNMVRIDTRASGLLFRGQAIPQTMRRAAMATLERGYTHFRLDGVSVGQDSVVSGYTVQGHGNFATVSADRQRVVTNAATVVMYRADEPGAQGAFDAAQVLRQYSQ